VSGISGELFFTQRTIPSTTINPIDDTDSANTNTTTCEKLSKVASKVTSKCNVM
jgi:hypothetical protein